MTLSTELKEDPALKVITAAGTKSEADLSLFVFFVSAGGGGFCCTEPVRFCTVRAFGACFFLTGLVDTSACCHTNADLIGTMSVSRAFQAS